MTLTRRPATTLPTIAFLLSILGCTDVGNDGAGSEQDFASFARTVFAELESHPITPGQPLQIGLFGDLDVLSGENVVMGRYRYRIDSADATPTAHMAFLLRAAEGGSEVPVVLTFSPEHHRWHLDDAQVVAREDTDESLRAVLQAHFDAWVSRAVENSQG